METVERAGGHLLGDRKSESANLRAQVRPRDKGRGSGPIGTQQLAGILLISRNGHLGATWVGPGDLGGRITLATADWGGLALTGQVCRCR